LRRMSMGNLLFTSAQAARMQSRLGQSDSHKFAALANTDTNSELGSLRSGQALISKKVQTQNNARSSPTAFSGGAMKCGTMPIQLLGYLGWLLFLVLDKVDPIVLTHALDRPQFRIVRNWEVGKKRASRKSSGFGMRYRRGSNLSSRTWRGA
jgi:hypothetical protein